MEAEGTVANAARLGREVFGPGLAAIAAKHPAVGEVRGTGGMWVLELVADRNTRKPLAPNGGSSPAMVALTARLKDHGMLPLVNSNQVYVVPPLNIADSDARRGLEMIDDALDVADGYVSGLA